MMGASFDSVKAQNKELSRSDSVSYAAGMNYTMGLIPYLSRQAGVDTTKMDDFIRGFQEYLKHTDDPTFKAYAAGFDIASQVSSRKLIRNVHMDVETREFDDLMVFVESSVKAAGGYVENSYSYYGSVYRGGGNTRSASLTLRIPAAGLDKFLSDVGGRANVISRNENVSDVTLTYVDMESHRNALRTEEESLINMLAKAETVEDLITIENRLADVRYQIESMESQLRTYDNLVDYATLSLSITEVEELTPVVEQSAWAKMGNGFMNSLHNIGRGLQNFGIGFVMNLPYILIWAAVILVIFLIAKALIKKPVRKIRAKLGKDVPAVKKGADDKAAGKAAQTAETADPADPEKPENP